MAFLDSERGELNVCIVFDGSPLSGKTTTVRSLAESLGGTVVSPEEMLGRTTYFDWLEYTGGLWNGHRIRCQLLTVPGQRSLGERRFELLRLADCVVFVFDSAEPQSRESLSSLEELTCVLDVCPQPRAPVLLQLNKRDLPNALPREEIQRLVPGNYPEIAETVATDSAGLRDVFVRSVRLALGRVERLKEAGELPLGRPRVQDSGYLLASLRAFEDGKGSSLADSVPLEAAAWSYLRALRERHGPETGASPGPASGAGPKPSDDPSAPPPPTGEMPPGVVWPPARGRTLLQHCSELPYRLHRRSGGSWEISFGTTWEGLSRGEQVFADHEEGRKHLLEITRMASDAERWLSPDRCLVLCPSGEEGWRLWEVKVRTPSLRSLLSGRQEGPPKIVVAALAQVLRLYRETAGSWPRESLRLRLDPGSCGLYLTRLVYTGFFSDPAEREADPAPGLSVEEESRRLSSVYLEAQGIPVEEALRELREIESEGPEWKEAAGSLAGLLSS